MGGDVNSCVIFGGRSITKFKNPTTKDIQGKWGCIKAIYFSHNMENLSVLETNIWGK
jgi:hypothetical protein